MSRAPILAALDRLPRFALAALPTPLERAANLSRALGVDLWVKRDDLTGLALGGNKVRKLEYLVGDALAARRDVAADHGRGPVELLPRDGRGGGARRAPRPPAPARHRRGAGPGQPAPRPPARRGHPVHRRHGPVLRGDETPPRGVGRRRPRRRRRALRGVHPRGVARRRARDRGVRPGRGRVGRTVPRRRDPPRPPVRRGGIGQHARGPARGRARSRRRARADAAPRGLRQRALRTSSARRSASSPRPPRP